MSCRSYWCAFCLMTSPPPWKEPFWRGLRRSSRWWSWWRSSAWRGGGPPTPGTSPTMEGCTGHTPPYKSLVPLHSKILICCMNWHFSDKHLRELQQGRRGRSWGHCRLCGWGRWTREWYFYFLVLWGTFYLLWGTSRYFEVLFSYFEVLLGTLRHFLATLRYF